ncbi:MAG: lysophospholipid acyltransferase family protein [Patescibacteria group bacterium]|nr:lysophospholipid acyltransferase family protein [Patescibacteria group bacterium]
MIKFIQFFIWLFGRIIWKLIFRIEVKNREVFKICPTKNIIFYANHSSYFDAFLASTNIPLSYYFKFKGFRFLAKRKHACLRWYARFIRMMGAYPLPKDKRGYVRAMPDTIKYAKQGYVIVIFPIPKLLRDINPGDAYPGVSYLADESRAGLLPVYIGNTYGWSFWELFRRHRRVQVIYGSPISHAEFSRIEGDYREKSRCLMERLKKLKDK